MFVSKYDGWMKEVGREGKKQGAGKVKSKNSKVKKERAGRSEKQRAGG
jgi:hypothetical protein